MNEYIDATVETIEDMMKRTYNARINEFAHEWLTQQLAWLVNDALNQAAQEVIAADQTGTQWGEIAAEVIREMKVK